MDKDTRVALVREDTVNARLQRAFDAAWNPHGQTVAGYIDAILAELFPETDKPLRVSNMQTATEALHYRGRGGNRDAGACYTAHDLIKEELNRG